MESEIQLVEELKKLFKSFPSGVEISSIYELYLSTFRKHLLLQQIQEGLTFMTFFEKHTDVFRVWKNSGDCLMVALKESHLEKPKVVCKPPMSVPPPLVQENLTKPTSMPTTQPNLPTALQPTEATLQSSAGHSVKPKWVAADIRTQGPGVPAKLQTVTVGWDHSKPPPPTTLPIRNAPTKAVPWLDTQYSDNVLPVTFGK